MRAHLGREGRLKRLCLILGALVALAGCGGGDEPSEPSTTTAPPAAEAEDETEGGEIVVAALGDSITAGSPLYDPDPQARAALGFGDDERSQFEYWASRADPTLEFRNCGVFGERTDEIATRLEECAAGADALIVQGGINDIAQSLAGGPRVAEDAARAAVENIDGMVASGQANGLRVAVTDVLPWNNGHPVADPAIAALNSGIEEVARERDVTLLRFHAELEAPDLAGTMALELTDDGDHPSIEGYRLLGELVAAELGEPGP